MRRPSSQNLAVALLSFAFASAICGCGPHHPENRTAKYFAGPTESLDDIVRKINENNSKVSSLWAPVRDVSVSLVDEKGKVQTVDGGGGTIMYRTPTDFYLRCDKALVGPLFVLGANRDSYWMTVVQQANTMWWGKTKNIGSPCVQGMPIDPTLVSQVLGISTIDTNFFNQPSPVMRFNNDDDAYVVTWNVRLSNQWATKQEVWYDRASLLPVRVYLYGVKGRVLLRADLAEHLPVKTSGNVDTGSKVATAYTLSFPDTGSSMILRLGAPLLSSTKGFPKDASFELPLHGSGAAKVVQVDEACAP